MRASSGNRRRPAIVATGASVATGALALALLPAVLGGAARVDALAAQASPTTTAAAPATSAVSGTITGSKTTVTPPPVATAAPPATAAAPAPAITARPQPASSAATVPTTVRRTATASTVAPSGAPSTAVTTAVPPTTGVAAASVAPTTAVTVVSTTAAAKVGDPGATRTVRGIAWTLLAMAALLAGLTAWFWRLTRPVPPVLGGLAVMGTTRWRQAPRHVQDELVSAVRVDVPALGPGAPADAAPAEADPDLAPITPVHALDGSFEWPPAASPEEIAALVPQYGWGRPARPVPTSGSSAPFLPASSTTSAAAAGALIGAIPAHPGDATPATVVPTGPPPRGPMPVIGSAPGDDLVPNLFADDEPSSRRSGGSPVPTAPPSDAGPLPPPLPAPRSTSEPAS